MMCVGAFAAEKGFAQPRRKSIFDGAVCHMQPNNHGGGPLKIAPAGSGGIALLNTRAETRARPSFAYGGSRHAARIKLSL